MGGGGGGGGIADVHLTIAKQFGMASGKLDWLADPCGQFPLASPSFPVQLSITIVKFPKWLLWVTQSSQWITNSFIQYHNKRYVVYAISSSCICRQQFVYAGSGFVAAWLHYITTKNCRYLDFHEMRKF